MKIHETSMKTSFFSSVVLSDLLLWVDGWPLNILSMLELPESVSVTSFGNRVFLGIIKFSILRWDHPGFSRWVQNPMASDCLRYGRRANIGKEQKVMWKRAQRLELHSHKPKKAWSRAKEDSPLEQPEGTWPCHSFTLDFWPPQLKESKFLLPPSLW